MGAGEATTYPRGWPALVREWVPVREPVHCSPTVFNSGAYFRPRRIGGLVLDLAGGRRRLALGPSSPPVAIRFRPGWAAWADLVFPAQPEQVELAKG